MARFISSARTVDLLGRQQIAGIPTAIHELFKNAHDAYADNVNVDFFRKDRLLVVRDDGVGMTREDLLKRWLVVGTPSKMGRGNSQPPTIDAKKIRRPVLGEKGIGRLAIGIVGPQVMVVSRAERDERLQPLAVAYVHWAIFGEPDLTLEDIDIPVREFAHPSDLNADAVRQMTGEFANCIRALAEDGRLDSDRCKKILSDVERFSFDPRQQESFLNGPESLRIFSGKRGTQFWVLPVDPMLDDDLKERDNKASPLELALLGFADAMSPGSPPPLLQVAFRDHSIDGEIVDVLDPSRFFGPKDFDNADHLISGSVDDFGQFRGSVRVYGEELQVSIPFADARGARIACGPFSVNIAYVQGQQRVTTLPDAEWLGFMQRARKHGGVYIYLDHIRVLPFGNPEFDWLEIEERRTKQAAYYFFSHRLMCGSVKLSRESNRGLEEKAGREGFIKNAAYLDLRRVLVDLLKRFAADFFREGGERSQRFESERLRLRRKSLARERREKGSKAKAAEFARSLRSAQAIVASTALAEECRHVAEKFSSKLDAAEFSETSAALSFIESAARDAFALLTELQRKIQVPRPRVGLKEKLNQEWVLHEQAVAAVVSQVFLPTRLKIEADLLTARSLLAPKESPRERAFRDAVEQCNNARSEIKKSITETKRLATKTSQGVLEMLADTELNAYDALDALQANLPQRLTSASGEAEARTAASEVLEEIESAKTTAIALSEMYRAELELITDNAEDDPVAQLEALEQENMDLRERLEDEMETTQLGMTVEIISHEFDHNIREIRTLLNELGAWAPKNPRLADLHARLRNAFQHLDGYLSLFTPLQRRLNRSVTTIRGDEIVSYLSRIFARKFDEYGASLEATESFRALKFWGYPSVYLPVFINLLDNAIFWMQESTTRRVILDSNASGLFVSDSGKGVPEPYQEAIFDRHFSLKPDGRGMGLTIARETMRRAGGNISLVDTGTGASFCITLPDGALSGQSGKGTE